ncbi:unnamed protein product [Amoebophrya sp. A120]|nr:unnamed protein product [Amoebophrya sp. A120]|eukprot:GSA120T00020582001.1
MLPEDLNPGNRDYKTVPLLSADEQNRNQEREGHNDLSGAASSSSRPARGNDTSDVGPSTSVASAANTHTSDDTRRTKQNTNTSKSGGNLFPVGGESSAAGSSSSSSSSSNSSSSNREPPLDKRNKDVERKKHYFQNFSQECHCNQTSSLSQCVLLFIRVLLSSKSKISIAKPH